MASEYEISDDELLDTADDPAQAASLHKALRTIAANPSVGPQLQEMAKDILSGRVGMREAVQSERYLSAIGARLDDMRAAAENMSPAERERSQARAEKMIEEREEREREAAGGGRRR
ncbi:hypothetical protein [Kitasatospora sp. NPDC088346]|uniref:hypothetical protein n=1 Tax=Kitasatospora sp. NPDC088346 TaxID=3364073 RepID=UPI003800C415